MARMKFKPATQPRGFQPIQLSRAGIQELRIRDNRIINNMQSIFDAEKEQQDRDRAAMQENAKLELDRIQRDRAIEVDNLENEKLAISQQAKVDIQQGKYDAEAANTFFDSIADFSKTAVAKSLENHANMIRDQEEAARKADITKERQESRKAYEALSKGAIRSDTDALEYASETGEPYIKTLQAIVGNAGRGAVQDRVIVNTLYKEIFDTEITKAAQSTDPIYTDAAGNKFSGVDAAGDPDKARIMTDTVRSGLAKKLGVSTAREGYLDPANEAITKRSEAIAERAVNIGIGRQREIAKAQAETLNNSGTAEGMIHAWNLTSNASAGGKAQAWSDLRALIDNPQNSLDEINKAAAAIDGVDLKNYDITAKVHPDGTVNKRYAQVEPHLTKRKNNGLQAYNLNRRLREAQVREQTYAMADQIEAAVRADPVAAERELTKIFTDANVPMPTLAKNIINNASEELEREETERLNFIIRHGALTEPVVNSFKHPTVRKAGAEAYIKQEEERYGPEAALIKKGFVRTAKLKTGMNPQEKGMGSQALLYQAKMETEYTKLLEQYRDPRVAYQKLNESIDAAQDPSKVTPDNPFRYETRGNNRLYFPNIEGTADRIAMRQTLDHALKTYGADISKYAYNVETEEQTQLTLITARKGKPVFSQNLISAVDYINKSNPNKKPLLYSEFFNAMQQQKTLQSGQYHGFVSDSLGTQTMDAMPPEVAKMIADAEHFMSNQLAQRATVTATGRLPFHLRSSMGGGAVQRLRNLIMRGEGGFTSANRGVAGDTPGGIPGLDRMTIADWKSLYQQYNTLGWAQFIEPTFLGAVNRLNLPDDTIMTGAMQNQLFNELVFGGVKRPRLSAYLNGTSDDLQGALEDVSLEWAAVANPNTGITSYPDVGGNAAHITSNEMAEVLQQVRAERIEMLSQLSSQTPQTPQTPQTQQTQTPARNRIGGGRPPGVDVGLGGPTSPESDPYYYVMGDSIALGATGTPRYRNNPKGTDNSDAQVSRSPQEVLAHLKKYEGYLKDATVKLSTGALNRTTNWEQATVAMLDFLKNEGVKDVKLIGFPNTPRYAGMRKRLDALAKQYGFNPPKHYTPGPDGVHPVSYKELSRF